MTTLKNGMWLVLALVFGRWRRSGPLVEGYTILLPSPMDMPFLLRLALEGLRHLDTAHCHQIIVIPDEVGTDRAAALRQVVDSCGDSRVELARLSPAARLILHAMRRSRGRETGNWRHWAMIVEGINRAKCDYIFLHDADAFFLESDGLERQYAECRNRGMATLGVMARWDPFFREMGYVVPGTYELMFSANWIRRYSPLDLQGRQRQTTHGLHEFDTMLYPQFQDFPSGKIGILEPPLRFVHFAGAIISYRTFCDRATRTVIDQDFRLLFLALMEDLLPSADGVRLFPTTSKLAEGINDPTAAVTYNSARADREYPTFRAMIEDLCNSRILQGERAGQIRASLSPFDRHYQSGLSATKLSSNEPLGGYVTEPTVQAPELAPKRLQLLIDIIPQLARLAILSNPTNPSHEQASKEMQKAAQTLGVELHVAKASAPKHFASAFTEIIAARAQAMIVLADGIFFDNYPEILAFTEISRLPALFPKKEIVQAGGLIAYDSSVPGINDAGSPNVQMKTELAINLRTAKTLGLIVPTKLIAAADQLAD